jgi:hypothetical protein
MFSLFLFCLFRIFCFQTTYTLSAIVSNRHLPLDQNGQQLVTGEASVLQHNNTYYFYFNNWGNCPGIDCCPTKGGCASCCFNTFPNYTKSCSNLQNGSDPYGLYHTVQSYSTVDFIKWNNLGVALPLASREPGIEFRPCVIFNKKTNLFVMWYENRGQGLKGYEVATSPFPNGPFHTVNSSVAVQGSGKIGDFNIFIDDDDIAYHVRTGFDVVQLNENYTGAASHVVHFTGSGEGPTMFKRNGIYYITTGSVCCACVGGSNIIVHRAKNVNGPWIQQGDVGTRINASTNIHDPNRYVTNAQGSAVFKVGDQYVYLGNQWNTGLKEMPAGPRNHDLLYFGLFHFNDVYIKQMVWEDSIDIHL